MIQIRRCLRNQNRRFSLFLFLSMASSSVGPMGLVSNMGLAPTTIIYGMGIPGTSKILGFTRVLCQAITTIPIRLYSLGELHRRMTTFVKRLLRGAQSNMAPMTGYKRQQRRKPNLSENVQLRVYFTHKTRRGNQSIPLQRRILQIIFTLGQSSLDD